MGKQGFYGMPWSKGSRSSNPQSDRFSNRRMSYNPEVGYFNWNLPGQVVNDCKHPSEPTQDIHAKLQNDPNKKRNTSSDYANNSNNIPSKNKTTMIHFLQPTTKLTNTKYLLPKKVSFPQYTHMRCILRLWRYVIWKRDRAHLYIKNYEPILNKKSVREIYI